MNNISLTGHLGRDPELTQDTEGNSRTTFSIAVKRPFTRDQTDWFWIQTRRKTADACAKYLKKGSLVGVIGRVETYKSGDVVKFVIVAEHVDFLTPKAERGSQPQQDTQPEQQQQPRQEEQPEQPPQPQTPPPPAAPPPSMVPDGPPPPGDDDDPFRDE